MIRITLEFATVAEALNALRAVDGRDQQPGAAPVPPPVQSTRRRPSQLCARLGACGQGCISDANGIRDFLRQARRNERHGRLRLA